jgi:hypothetical protein
MAVFCASVAHVPERTLRYGSRNPPFSARHDLNLNRPYTARRSLTLIIRLIKLCNHE